MLSLTEQSPVNSLYMERSCAGDNLSSINNEVSFQTHALCALSTDFITISLKVKWSGLVWFSSHEK